MNLMSQYRLLLASICFVFVGGFLAWGVQTNLGSIDVQDIRFQSESGATLSGLLYIPETATTDTPAPGVLAVHGYINSRETQSAYAIELAKRGYVVLSMDQRGHGYSDSPSFAEGFGGPAGLQHLRTLEQVDTNQIVLIGHSMGGWTVLSAAAAHPQDYSSVIVSGSSTGTFGVPAGDANFPRNFGLVYGKYDEFSASMWGARTGAEVVDTEKLMDQFGTESTVEIGRMYGNIQQGTARRLSQPAQTHPSNHITQSGVAPVIDWVQLTSNPPNPDDPERQSWPLKEFGTFLSLLGGILFIFAFGKTLLNLSLFAPLKNSPAPAAGIHGKQWWISVAIFIAIPALSYFPFQSFASQLPTNAWLGQNITTGIMVWAIGNGLISFVLLSLWHFAMGGKAAGSNAGSLGLSYPADGGLKSLLLTLLFSAAVIAGLYVLLFVNHSLFTADFRFWVVALKLMNLIHFHEFLVYLIPFTLFFIVTGAVLHGQLRGDDSPANSSLFLKNGILMGLGILLLLMYQYIPLFFGSTLAIPAQSLLTIVAIQFVVLLPVIGLISTYFFQLTGRVYAGSFINGMFITWMIVAGQATHFAY
jgi:pimeloyl-ACP methyl ester carboxylesterase